jgi:hypothetical protein
MEVSSRSLGHCDSDSGTRDDTIRDEVRWNSGRSSTRRGEDLADSSCTKGLRTESISNL